ncbi:MAG TPA: arsenite methyltransferase [Candidatus Kapabacteria bacterium]|nr:arsenite methyltransferase [Candidatus Kapabacteria bacterium]
MEQLTSDEIRTAVRENYGKVADSGCGCGPSCCEPSAPLDLAAQSRALGYSDEEIAAVPEGANLGLGCGNPQAIAAMKPGETVLDLGSGAGFDAFLAATAVGPTGRVIGVDMTPSMLAKARENAAKSGRTNVEFRLGEIEQLPVADATVDVIISNCVINLSPEKGRVFNEAYRVLRAGGRLAISDVVATAELPASIRGDLALYSGCVAGASTIDELEAMMHAAGFTDIVIAPKDTSREFIREWAPGTKIEDYVVSATIEARKK